MTVSPLEDLERLRPSAGVLARMIQDGGELSALLARETAAAAPLLPGAPVPNGKVAVAL